MSQSQSTPDQIIDPLLEAFVASFDAEVDRKVAAIETRMTARGVDPDQPCGDCGRDNRHGTHDALQMTGHLSHDWYPAAPEVG